MSRWRSTLRITSEAVELLVTDQCCNDLMKARLPCQPRHPRALLTLFEGLALWSGGRIGVATFVEPHVPSSYVSDLFDTDLWPEDSALVAIDLPESDLGLRLRGPGRFDALYRLHGRVGR